MDGECRKEDIGTIFRATFKDGSDIVDISSATTKELIFKKPSGSVVYKAGTFYSSGTDGQLQYTTVSGDLDETGLWSLQGYVEISSNKHKSDIYKFRVYDNL